MENGMLFLSNDLFKSINIFLNDGYEFCQDPQPSTFNLQS
jgi:hypothetical protein